MHKIGDTSPEFPMHRIIDIQVLPDWGVVRITLNGKYDGVHDYYSLPMNPN